MTTCLIIPAAGDSKRFAESGPPGEARGMNKVEASLGDRPVFIRAIECFKHRDDIGPIVLAVNPNGIDQFKFKYGDRLGFLGVKIVPGGTVERWETVANALKAAEFDGTHFAVHDAARPLASTKLVDRVFAAAERYAAVVPGMPVNNTLKRVAPSAGTRASEADMPNDPMDVILDGAGKMVVETWPVVETVDRSDLYEIQTPQVFEADLLRRAYTVLRDGQGDGAKVTDDASLIERLGEPVHIVEGETTNLKITRAGDLKLAQILVDATREDQAAKLAKKRLFADDDDEL